MALWAWVGGTARELRAAGHTELAAAVERMPRLALEGNLTRLDAELPQALRVARAAEGVPRLEEYLRHWPLAARVGPLKHGAIALADAEAHRGALHAQGTGYCPPPVCGAENLLSCYANIDGPGYAVDRAALLTEAAQHTEPGQPAFEALALAHAAMLVDDERPDEAVHHLDAQAARVRATGTDVGLYYGFGYVRALRHLDRHSAALDVLAHLENNGVARWPEGAPRTDAHRRIRFERARLMAWLARTGRRPAEEALAVLPDVLEAEAHPSLRLTWVEAVEQLVEVGVVRNDWRIGATLTSWTRYLEKVGAYRPCLEMALIALRLATARGARWVALSTVQRAQRALFRLRRADDLRDDLIEAREGAARIPPSVLQVEPEELLVRLRAEQADEVDPERQADLVLAALELRPDDTTLLAAFGQVGRTLKLADVVVETQWARVRRAPGDQMAALALLETLLHDEDVPGVRSLVRTLSSAAAMHATHA
ncbi:hypothetical protein ACQEU5_15945 [Marinactinospora thermotolerans]|uniref:hypothetical protein n=1 Tax=Marinactinospora thermotolerans TaxID=531310 RepID=UPI003D8F2923